jgi:DNA primase
MGITDEIKARIPILDFVARSVQLQRAGRSYKACCPFHNEKTPSFVVNPDWGSWHCFGACNEGGDIFSFLMKKEHIEFREALQILAKEAGIALNSSHSFVDYSRLYESNRKAEEFYRVQLLGSAKARLYLQQRGITQAVANEFGLGYAPDSWTQLRDHLTQQGFSLQEMINAGLVRTNSAGNSQYDFFRDRLMIPIADEKGQTIGFGGRAFGDDKPKYLNTADTPIFHKSTVIYGFHRAKDHMRKSDSVVIMEGYMDVIAAHQFGFFNSVACMGTALSKDQIHRLRRQARNFDFAMDSDQAGQLAVIRGLNQVRQTQQEQDDPKYVNGKVQLGVGHPSRLWVIGLPDNKDPDDIIRQDMSQWQSLLASAKPLIEYYIDLVCTRTDIQSAEGKAYLVKEIAPLIAELSDEVERSHYSLHLSKLTNTPDQVIENQVRHIIDATPVKAAPVRAPLAWEHQVETYILAIFFSRPDVFSWFSRTCTFLRIAPYSGNDIGDSQNKELFSLFCKKIALGNTTEINGEDLFLVEYRQYIAALPAMTEARIKETVFRSIVQLRKKRLTTISEWISQYAAEATALGQQEHRIEYERQLLGNRNAIYALDKALGKAVKHGLFSAGSSKSV